MKIGLFGGTFDPPHNGHLVVAEHARNALGLDSVRFIPAAFPPHKQGLTSAPARDRLAMIELALIGHAGLSVSDIELTRNAVSYTVETILELRSGESGKEFVLLIGMDNAVEFHLWRDPARILDLASVVALTRPGFEKSKIEPQFRDRLVYCTVPAVPISSTEIRNRVSHGDSISGDVCPEVEEYIRVHKLYMAH